MHRLREAIVRFLSASGCFVALLSGGCQSSGPQTDSVGAINAPSGADPQVAAAIERDHVIGPAAARELNYRVAWQHPTGGKGVKHLSVQGDSVFVLDGQNFLTRLRVEDGSRLWRLSVADPIEEILGVTLLGDRLYLTTGGSVLVLEAASGSQVGKQVLDKIANTEPAVYDQFLVYGSRNGQLVWHSTQIGYRWRAYQVAPSIPVPPVLADGYVVTVGNEGTVMVLSASAASQVWSKKLLEPVVCAPAAGNSAIYVAGMDQYLWAYDITSGRTLWKVLTESELRDSPVLIAEKVYQQIPRQGLSCFEAMPPDSPGGQLVWKNPSVRGNVIAQRRDELLAWDQAGKKLSVLTATRGSVVKDVGLPQAERVLVVGENAKDLYAASADGRVVRVTSRN
ncbi:MAG: PQQ-binding-like beta-propeller repeat protein [Phycisphaerales bacterium]|nr:PQQ-binding-like beta-propeller repeat protein [Phycisphaerales bacterium]